MDAYSANRATQNSSSLLHVFTSTTPSSEALAPLELLDPRGLVQKRPSTPSDGRRTRLDDEQAHARTITRNRRVFTFFAAVDSTSCCKIVRVNWRVASLGGFIYSGSGGFA